MTIVVSSILSPNFTPRPKGVNDVWGGLVHWTASYASARNIALYFKNPASGVSATSVIGRDGAIVRCVALKNAAWHAGTARYDFNDDHTISDEERRVNTHTVGWELCHVPGQNWPDIQIRALAREVRRADRECPNLKLRNLTDHEAVSLTGKWDVDGSFPAGKMFWYILHPYTDPPANIYGALPDWAQRQVDEIKK